LIQAVTSCENEYVLIDGFPRNQRNFDVWFEQTEKLKDLFRVGKGLFICLCLDHCAFIEVSQATMRDRMVQRRKDSVEQRSDDTEEILNKRIEVFMRETMPIKERFKRENKLILLNGENSPEEILEEYIFLANKRLHQ
jgi:adenylate kinase family enzyme